MLLDHRDEDIHERFNELSALANAGALTIAEWTELSDHLNRCRKCRDIHNEYLVLSKHGMPLLGRAPIVPGDDHWDDGSAREKLSARVQAAERQPVRAPSFRWPARGFLPLGIAAAALLIVGACAYWLESRRVTGGLTPAPIVVVNRVDIETIDALIAEKRALSELLKSRTKTVKDLETEASEREQELSKLRLGLRAQESGLNELLATKDSAETQLRATLQQRDSLAARLETLERNSGSVRAEVASLRDERDQTAVLIASLKSRIEELSASSREQDRRLLNSEQYLASDRDIRELMGARNLYIADVYDVDSSSRTRKPFGRVFYTHGKSLIFYAFDLDRKPGTTKASAGAFQVWGKKSSGERQPLSLGILFHDSEANRRWVLRFDDSKQLAEINAVFVTVEPNGGSIKPTGKPFLFALLRKEVNHP